MPRCNADVRVKLWIPQKGMENDWVMHLEAAGALVCTLDIAPDPEETSPKVLLEQPWWELYPDVTVRPELRFLSDEDKAAYQIFLTMYSWLFILSCALRGLTAQSTQSISRTRALFHKRQSKLRDLMGCEDWVMLTILDIAVLADWKKRMKASGTLSLRELNRRADDLEQKLNSGLAALQVTKHFFDSKMDKEKYMVTEVFIYATVTYLHIVVSGYFPELPEIRQSVIRTLEAMEAMQDPGHVRYVTWPFGMTGSMASEPEQHRFRALVPKPKVGEHPLVMCMWTLDILETCWAMRRAQPKGSEAYDILSAMNHMGTRLLLI
jgi:hypothetical protein